jgi:NADPH:quinone reductase-like Zn-dependent oxidoreductase
MKAIFQDAYGPPELLRLEEVLTPVVNDGAVLLRVHAAGVNPLDWHYMRGTPYLARMAMGIRNPKVRARGVDVAGRVEAVGKGVKRLRPGDDVFGLCHGAFAEYATALEDHLIDRPAGMTYEQAASVPVAALTALQGLRAGGVRTGQRVLINGASGGIGMFAVQIATSYGAEVTAVCSSRNVDLVRSIGADHVVDYTREDFTKAGARYDLILDNVGNHTLSAVRRALAPGGLLVYNSGASMRRIAMAQLLWRLGGQNVRMFNTRRNHEDLAAIGQLIESGKLRSVIDRTYPLAQTAEAIAYVEAGHARGKVIVTIG